MFQLVVFDLDGTLIDSRRDLANATNALLADYGAAPLPEDRIGRMVGDGAATLVARAFDAAGIQRPPDALARFLKIYSAHLLDHTRPYPGMTGVLGVLGEPFLCEGQREISAFGGWRAYVASQK